MSEEKKFTEEELNKVKDIQTRYIDLQTQFGQIAVSKLRLEEQLSTITNNEIKTVEEFEKIQKEEKDFLKKITEKYGEGNLNAETGVFIPNK